MASGRFGKFARDYSGRGPNCNAATPSFGLLAGLHKARYGCVVRNPVNAEIPAQTRLPAGHP
jgi:hypothetical protein